MCVENDFDALNLTLELRQKAQLAIDNEDTIQAWRNLAEAAKSAGLKSTQIRGLENVVNTAQGLSSIVNYIYNQIARLRPWRDRGWGTELARLYEALPSIADDILTEVGDQTAVARAVERQSLILHLARGMTAHFVSYNLFLLNAGRR